MRLLERFYIKNKKGQKVRFKRNRAQEDFEKNRTGRDLILKARQLGFTTLIQLRKLERVLIKDSITSATLAHKFGKTQDIFAIAKYAWESLPEEFRNLYEIKYDSAKELFFANTSSRYFVDMDVRSGTVQDLHISELAFHKDMEGLFSSTLESVPKEGQIVIETTANGLNDFHKLWEASVAGKTEFKPHFYNWTWDKGYWETPPENSTWKEQYQEMAFQYNLIADIQERFNLTDNQFYWYFLKARRLKEQVKQEYPTVPEEAFLSSSGAVFDLFKVASLVQTKPIDTVKGVEIYQQPLNGHKYIVGCDTAEGLEGDSTTIEVLDFTDANKVVEVASFSSDTIRPDQVADVLIAIGEMYNNAFLIPERNGSGLTTVLKLQEKNYKNLFVNKNISSKTQRAKNEYGWRTTSGNRDMMIDDFIEYFEEDMIQINSKNIIEEMKTFVALPNGLRRHDEGYHDDSLFAMFLAIQGNKYHRQVKIQTFDRDRLGI